MNVREMLHSGAISSPPDMIPDLSSGLFNVSSETISYAVPVEGVLPTLLCWATNELGEQHKPCTINLSTAGNSYS